MVKIKDPIYFQEKDTATEERASSVATDESDGVIRNKLFGMVDSPEMFHGPITFVQDDLTNEMSSHTSNEQNCVLTLLYQHKKRNMESLTASCMVFFFIPAVALIAYASIYQRQCQYECACSTITGIYGMLNLMTCGLLLLLRLYHYAHATSLNYEKLSKAVLIIIHIGLEVLFAIYAYKIYLTEREIPNLTWTNNLAIGFVLKFILALNMVQIIYFLYSEKKLFDYENLLRVLTKDSACKNHSTIREVYYLPGVTDEELNGV